MRFLWHLPAPRLRPLGRVGLVALAVALLTAAGCSKSNPSARGTPSPGSTSGHSPTPTPSSTGIPTADFSYQGVRPDDAQNRPSANGPAGDAAKKAVQAVDTYYDTAFLQPSDWAAGASPASPACSPPTPRRRWRRTSRRSRSA